MINISVSVLVSIPFKFHIIVFALLSSRSIAGPVVDWLAFGQWPSRNLMTLWHRHLSTVHLQLSRLRSRRGRRSSLYMSMHAGRYVTARGRYRSSKSCFVWFSSEAGRGGDTINHPSDYPSLLCCSAWGALSPALSSHLSLSLGANSGRTPIVGLLIVDGMGRMRKVGGLERRSEGVWRTRRVGRIREGPADGRRLRRGR